MNYLKLKQGDIVIGHLPYSDFSQIVKRPLLVASNDKYNEYSDDIICIKVTSKIKDRPYTVELTKKDVESGTLKYDGSIKIDSLFFISKKLLTNPIASVKQSILEAVKENLKALFFIK